MTHQCIISCNSFITYAGLQTAISYKNVDLPGVQVQHVATQTHKVEEPLENVEMKDDDFEDSEDEDIPMEDDETYDPTYDPEDENSSSSDEEPEEMLVSALLLILYRVVQNKLDTHFQ